jgi:membrane protein required for colicin V production
MFIDVVVLIVVVLALIKGFSKGLIMALFSTLALIIGLACAVKFSAVVAPAISKSLGIDGQFLPILSFLAIFIGVILLIRLAGKALEKTLETASIGFLNRGAGAVLYLVLYLAITSILFYYIEKMGLLGQEVIKASLTWAWIAPWGPAVLDGIGMLIPIFKNMFDSLNGFFEQVTTANHLNAKSN